MREQEKPVQVLTVVVKNSTGQIWPCRCHEVQVCHDGVGGWECVDCHEARAWSGEYWELVGDGEDEPYCEECDKHVATDNGHRVEVES